MAIYLVYACEQSYGGLHGMYNCDVIEADSEEEADEYGEEMSYDVMESYSSVIDTMYEEAYDAAQTECIEEDTEEYEDYVGTYVEDLMANNLDWSVYELSSEHTVDEYREMLRNNKTWEDLRDKYAIRKDD